MLTVAHVILEFPQKLHLDGVYPIVIKLLLVGVYPLAIKLLLNVVYPTEMK